MLIKCNLDTARFCSLHNIISDCSNPFFYIYFFFFLYILFHNEFMHDDIISIYEKCRNVDEQPYKTTLHAHYRGNEQPVRLTHIFLGRELERGSRRLTTDIPFKHGRGLSKCRQSTNVDNSLVRIIGVTSTGHPLSICPISAYGHYREGGGGLELGLFYSN